MCKYSCFYLVRQIAIMDFGIYLRQEITYSNMLKLALEADQLGYYGAYLNDHVIGFANEGHENYLEAWTTMTGIGVQTKHLRVGQIVLFNSIRNPAFLAKSIATLDNMTGGRYDLLLGAGWNEREYVGYDLMNNGKGIPSAGERVARLREAVQILRHMLNNPVTNFDGTYWKLVDAINLPLPVQDIQITIGAEKPKMLELTAKYADGLNIPLSSIPNILQKITEFTQIAENQKKKLTDFRISGFMSFMVTKNPDGVKAYADQIAKNLNVPLQEIIDTRMIGTSEMIIAKLRQLQDAGMNMIVSGITVDEGIKASPLEYFKDTIVSQI